jgi:low affinity Fe/Cu permease
MKKLSHWFTVFAKWAAWATGHPMAFVLAASTVVGWAIMGPLFGFSDTWQLVINTGTTIITFLMVFLIQNTQNRDTAAMQIKLDELIRATQGAHNALLDLEELEEHELERVRNEYEELAADARQQLDQGKTDTEVRETKPHSADSMKRKAKK